MSGSLRGAVVCILMVAAGAALGSGGDLSAHQFLVGAFGGEPPAPRKLWLSGEQREVVAGIVGHTVGLRISYWQSHQRSAWILDEIGKEQPITIGVIVERDKLVDVSILAFRESRGGEVRYPFFTHQFIGLGLTPDNNKLNGPIDGVSGATMSVGAVTRAVTAALTLSRLIPIEQP